MDSTLTLPFMGMVDDVASFLLGHRGYVNLVALECHQDTHIVKKITVEMDHEHVGAFVDDWSRNFKP